MPDRFLETDRGFINTRFIERIWWDKATDGWACETVHDETVLYPKHEDAVARLLQLDA